MPIVTIELLEDKPEAGTNGKALQKLGDALGELFGSAPGGTWVRLVPVARAHYVENGQPVPASVRQALVRVLKADLDDAAALAAQARQISALVAEHLRRPSENVHVLFEPAGRGRIAFGGELVT